MKYVRSSGITHSNVRIWFENESQPGSMLKIDHADFDDSTDALPNKFCKFPRGFCVGVSHYLLPLVGDSSQ